MVKANIFKPVFIAIIFCVLMMVMLPSATAAQNVKIISASPGDTVSLPGTGDPNSQIKLEVSATINVGTTQSGSTYRYKSSMNGLHIPGGNSMSITVSPVDTLTVSGSMMGIGLSMDGSVSNHVGSFSKSVPSGTYNIVVEGIANGSPSSVSTTVHASQNQNVGNDGKYTASISTSGLPSTIYTVTQDGTVVALVYLGVPVPATPTPIATATATPTPSTSANSTALASQLGGQPGDGTNTSGNSTLPAGISNATTNGSATGTPSASASQDSNSLITAVLAIICGAIIGIVAAYLIITRKR